MSLLKQFQVAVVSEINLNITGVTFAAGANTSSVLTCGGASPTGIFIPSTFTASNITFLVSKTPNGTFYPLTNFDGSAFAVAVTASTFVPLLPAMFNSLLYVQLQTSSNQVSATYVDFALCPIFQGLHN